jgi:AraC-like DNA-binding protein
MRSRVVESSDADEFATLIRPHGCDLLATGRGSFNGRCIMTDIGRLFLQRGREDLSRLIQVTVPRSGVFFLTEPGPSMFLNGSEIGYDHLGLLRSGNEYLSRLSGPTSWGAMTLVDDNKAAARAWYLGDDTKWSGDCTVLTPPPARLAALRALHAAAGDLTQVSARPPMSPASEAELETRLVHAMVACIDLASVRADTTAVQHHRIVIRRFRELLEANLAGPMRMSRISDAIGVSGRTLRLACRQQFGVSPTQYLMFRRMRLARLTLRDADPALATVTGIATQLGFWELGRFSVRYRQIFGETPSATLRSAAFQTYRPTPSDHALA